MKGPLPRCQCFDHWSSHPNTVSCHKTLFAGLSTHLPGPAVARQLRTRRCRVRRCPGSNVTTGMGGTRARFRWRPSVDVKLQDSVDASLRLRERAVAQGDAVLGHSRGDLAVNKLRVMRRIDAAGDASCHRHRSASALEKPSKSLRSMYAIGGASGLYD